MKRRTLLTMAAAAAACPRASALDAADWLFLDNGRIRLGLKKSSGGGIGWLSKNATSPNLLNHYDHGRLIQQSYYGKDDGSIWSDKPLRWNPVQGGDYKGAPATLLECRGTDTTAYSRTTPRNWAGGELLTDCVMEQWITLVDASARLTIQFTYNGKDTHPPHHHEIPAVFLDSSLSTLITYEEDKPWTGGPLQRTQPGWPNESRRMTEKWAAYVNKDDEGAGLWVPAATGMTCYRFSKEGAPGACVYFAPLVKFAITPGLKWRYEAILAMGTSTEIREIFRAAHLAAAPATPPAR